MIKFKSIKAADLLGGIVILGCLLYVFALEYVFQGFHIHLRMPALACSVGVDALTATFQVIYHLDRHIVLLAMEKGVVFKWVSFA